MWHIPDSYNFVCGYDVPLEYLLVSSILIIEYLLVSSILIIEYLLVSSIKKKKINFVTTWDPMFPDINEALGKFQHILEEDDECRNLFPKGSFRVSYKRGHKNLKELIAPSKIALPDDCEERGNSKRQYQGKCVKCGGVVNL